jgi:hypothetical protein
VHAAGRSRAVVVRGAASRGAGGHPRSVRESGTGRCERGGGVVGGRTTSRRPLGPKGSTPKGIEKDRDQGCIGSFKEVPQHWSLLVQRRSISAQAITEAPACATQAPAAHSFDVWMTLRSCSGTKSPSVFISSVAITHCKLVSTAKPKTFMNKDPTK